MREILFRGKRMSDGEWLYGSLLQVNRKGATECCIHSDRYSHLIDPATVGQFTGLTDKNGKKIFEGDILATKLFGNHIDKGVVRYGNYNCSCCDGVYGWYVDGGDIRDAEELSEVIGNIHDNPELMEVE
jgi:uncharacterized phage protein (TIGR01671 family)